MRKLDQGERDDVTYTLAEYITEARFEDLPENVIAAVKGYILDSLGCTLGGSRLKPGKIMIDLFGEMGGKPEATLLSTKIRVPCLNAAYVNSSLSNLLDFDDTYAALAHPGATTIPPALALGESLRISGRMFLLAVVLAYEVMIRIGVAITPSPDRYRKVMGLSVFQIFGAVVVGGKLLGLDTRQMMMAMGFAGASAPVPNSRKIGLELDDRPFSWIKNNFGWASMGGILAAMLASREFVGTQRIFEGDRGFWIMASSDQCNYQKMTEGLGTQYLTLKNSYKPYSACRWVHSSLDATGKLMEKNSFDPECITSIQVETFEEIVNKFGVVKPENIIDAQFSLPYLMALELLGRSSRFGLREEDLEDSRVIELANKVTIRENPQATKRYEKDRLMVSSVIVKTEDGKTFSETVSISRGDPDNALSQDEILEKFSHLVAPVVGERETERLIKVIDRLESVKDISELVPSPPD